MAASEVTFIKDSYLKAKNGAVRASYTSGDIHIFVLSIINGRSLNMSLYTKKQPKMFQYGKDVLICVPHFTTQKIEKLLL